MDDSSSETFEVSSNADIQAKRVYIGNCGWKEAFVEFEFFLVDFVWKRKSSDCR